MFLNTTKVFYCVFLFPIGICNKYILLFSSFKYSYSSGLLFG